MRFAAALLVILAAACASKPAADEPRPGLPGAAGSPPIASRGLSCDDPIVINAANENDGINAEHAWVRQNYPGATWGTQGVGSCNGKPADIVQIETANGQKVTLYFDISGWFGKV